MATLSNRTLAPSIRAAYRAVAAALRDQGFPGAKTDMIDPVGPSVVWGVKGTDYGMSVYAPEFNVNGEDEGWVIVFGDMGTEPDQVTFRASQIERVQNRVVATAKKVVKMANSNKATAPGGAVKQNTKKETTTVATQVKDYPIPSAGDVPVGTTVRYFEDPVTEWGEVVKLMPKAGKVVVEYADGSQFDFLIVDTVVKGTRPRIVRDEQPEPDESPAPAPKRPRVVKVAVTKKAATPAPAKAVRTCSVCGEAGHNARTCPDNAPAPKATAVTGKPKVKVTAKADSKAPAKVVRVKVARKAS